MVRICNLLPSAIIMAILFSSAAYAGDGNVLFRGNVRDDSTRIVMTGKSTPQYEIKTQGNKYIIHLSGSGKIDPDLSGLSGLPRIISYKVISPQIIEIEVAEKQKVKYFSLSNKIIFDIKGVALIKPENKPPEIKSPEKLPNNIIVDNTTVTPKSAEVIPAPKPIIINIISTNSIAVTAYLRGGYLWVAEDSENLAVEPNVSGIDAKFTRIPVKGFSLFKMKLPPDIKLHSAGGGLIWRITNDDKNDKLLPSVEVLSMFGKDIKNAPALLWPTKNYHRMIEFIDPDMGDKVKLVFVNNAIDNISMGHNFAEIEILPSLIGMALLPRTDDFNIAKNDEGIIISRVNGMALSLPTDKMANKKEDIAPDANAKRNIFDFKSWQIGNKKDISENQRIIMSALGTQTDVKRAENLIVLGRMMLAFGYTSEAIGYFDLAADILPDLNQSPEFQVTRAVAESLTGRSKEAFTTFSTSQLGNLDEIKTWKSVTLADLDDWQQAAEILPKDISFIEKYPPEILNPVGLQIAEIILRSGDAKRAKDVLDMVISNKDKTNLSDESAFDYLSGEYARQTGKFDESLKLWGVLSTGADDLFRTRAKLAMSSLAYEKKDITIDKAIDNLEGLRYAWRGDALEVSVNNNLAKLYLQKGEPLKALTLLRNAVSLNPNTEQSKKIDAYLHETFVGLFTPTAIKDLTPIDAMTIYTEFADLVPAGAEGTKISRQLAERLVDADLLPRAQALLQKQLDNGVAGADGADIAIRLASLLLMDGRADKVIPVLDKADGFLNGLTQEEIIPRKHDITVLRANALSTTDKPQAALEELAKIPQDQVVLKARADIAWRNKKWQDAADALEQFLGQQNISLSTPLSDDQAVAILNWAVALYLSDNRYVLANVRERYADAMAQTPYAKKFDVITRPRQMALLADKDTIQSIINETDMFKDFLSTFKQDPSKIVAKPNAVSNNVENNNGGNISAPVNNNVPDNLKNSPLLKTDEVSAD